VASAFERARGEGRAALIAYLAAGDPDMETTAALAGAAAEAGADVIELGLPFSDPLADGPIIQAAYTRALDGGVTVRRVLERLPDIAGDTGLPIVLMTALNPVLAYGPDAFCRDAAGAGASGLLVPDLLPEDAGSIIECAGKAGLETVFLGAPDTSRERLAAAADASSGFLYLISRRGVTGPNGGVGEGLEEEVERARKLSGVPVAVGFGVTTGEDARRVAAVADGVIVGSVLVQDAADAFQTGGGQTDRSAGLAAAVVAVKQRTEELRDGIHRAGASPKGSES
jgi:tryptophan synthase alpha chain